MGRFNLTRSVLVAVSLASVLGTSLASAQAPDGPAVTDGSYTITYVPAPNANVSGLQEKIGSAGTWQNVPDSDHDGSVSFTNKPDGTFYYRKWDFITGSSLDDMETIYSAATKVIVTNGPIPTADSLSEQLRYTYATRIGDINSDGRKDIYLYRTSGCSESRSAAGISATGYRAPSVTINSSPTVLSYQ